MKIVKISVVVCLSIIALLIIALFLKVLFFIILLPNSGLTDENPLISYDIDNPMLKEKFNFHEKNFSKIFELDFKENGIYEIGILDLKEMIPINLKFKGELNFKFNYENKIIFEENISSTDVGICSTENKMDFFKALTFLRFRIPLNGKFKIFSLKISVITPDEQFKTMDSIMLYISESSSP